MKILSHFTTITRHRHEVFKNCIKAGIPLQGLLHDLSKYSPSEFIPGVKYYQGYRSPNEAERESVGYSSAWIHHKGVNKHHFEHWVDYNPVTRRQQSVPMPDKYVVEMFCDRVAASKIYLKEKYTDSSPLDYFLKGKATRMIADETSEKIEMLLRMLSEKGEKATFEYIRNTYGRAL